MEIKPFKIMCRKSAVSPLRPEAAFHNEITRDTLLHELRRIAKKEGSLREYVACDPMDDERPDAKELSEKPNKNLRSVWDRPRIHSPLRRFNHYYQEKTMERFNMGAR
jgi:hypothetical protein